MRKPNTAKAPPEAQDLRQRAAQARDAAGRFNRRRAPAERPAAGADPAIAVTTVFRASWDALSKVLDAEAPDELVAELEDAQTVAYERLRAARPTTPEGYRALAECWAMVLKGYRGDEPGMTAADHAADCLIAGAAVCTPTQSTDWYGPPPGFMASPAIEPVGFARITDGIALELERLRSIAMAELKRRTGPESRAEDFARISRELRLDVLAKAAPLDDSILGQVDLAVADIDELRTIQEKMRHLSDVAYAMASQGCCERNAAGDLMMWLGDELTTVESRAADELQRRQPADIWDQRSRLGAVAERIILNGDVTETATFIRDLATFATEQAGR